MLTWTLTFFLLTVITGLLGFSHLAGSAAAIAQTLFYIFAILLVVATLTRSVSGRFH